VKNVKDITGNTTLMTTAKMFANTFKAGVLNYKRWNWPSGNNIPNLVKNAFRYANPTVVETRTIGQTGGQNNTYVAGVYVDRVDGVFIPTVTTNYVFLMSADNDGYLYLSTDSIGEPEDDCDVGWQNTACGQDQEDTTKRRGDLAGGGRSKTARTNS
jgi:hypothetical protein